MPAAFEDHQTGVANRASRLCPDHEARMQCSLQPGAEAATCFPSSSASSSGSSERTTDDLLASSPRCEVACVPHVRQRFSWDCGLACVLMVLRGLGVRCSYDALRKLCPTTSIWTVDLAHLMAGFGVPVTFHTITIGIHHGYAEERFYMEHLTADQARVAGLFEAARCPASGVVMAACSTGLGGLVGHLGRGGAVAVVLVDKRKLDPWQAAADACWNSVTGYTSQTSYLGHYVLLVGYDPATAEFLVHDPDQPRGPTRVCTAVLEAAWRCFGTDEDVLLLELGGQRPQQLAAQQAAVAGFWREWNSSEARQQREARQAEQQRQWQQQQQWQVQRDVPVSPFSAPAAGSSPCGSWGAAPSGETRDASCSCREDTPMEDVPPAAAAHPAPCPSQPEQQQAAQQWPLLRQQSSHTYNTRWRLQQQQQLQQQQEQQEHQLQQLEWQHNQQQQEDQEQPAPGVEGVSEAQHVPGDAASNAPEPPPPAVLASLWQHLYRMTAGSSSGGAPAGSTSSSGGQLSDAGGCGGGSSSGGSSSGSDACGEGDVGGGAGTGVGVLGGSPFLTPAGSLELLGSEFGSCHHLQHMLQQQQQQPQEGHPVQPEGQECGLEWQAAGLLISVPEGSVHGGSPLATPRGSMGLDLMHTCCDGCSPTAAAAAAQPGTALGASPTPGGASPVPGGPLGPPQGYWYWPYTQWLTSKPAAAAAAAAAAGGASGGRRGVGDKGRSGSGSPIEGLEPSGLLPHDQGHPVDAAVPLDTTAAAPIAGQGPGCVGTPASQQAAGGMEEDTGAAAMECDEEPSPAACNSDAGGASGLGAPHDHLQQQGQQQQGQGQLLPHTQPPPPQRPRQGVPVASGGWLWLWSGHSRPAAAPLPPPPAAGAAPCSCRPGDSGGGGAQGGQGGRGDDISSSRDGGCVAHEPAAAPEAGSDMHVRCGTPAAGAAAAAAAAAQPDAAPVTPVSPLAAPPQQQQQQQQSSQGHWCLYLFGSAAAAPPGRQPPPPPLQDAARAAAGVAPDTVGGSSSTTAGAAAGSAAAMVHTAQEPAQQQQPQQQQQQPVHAVQQQGLPPQQPHYWSWYWYWGRSSQPPARPPPQQLSQASAPAAAQDSPVAGGAGSGAGAASQHPQQQPQQPQESSGDVHMAAAGDDHGHHVSGHVLSAA